MKAPLLAGLVLLAAAPSAAAFMDRVSAYVRELNQGGDIASAVRPEGVANRLEITFDARVPEAQRGRRLQEIGSRFLQALFQDAQIPTATIVERAADGGIVDRQVISLGELNGQS